MKSQYRPVLLLWVLCTLCSLQLFTSPVAAQSAETPAQHDKRMGWFREARFGLFIHWGVYSVPAGEWAGKTNYGEWFMEETKMPVSQYEKFASRFNPVKFDASQWVQMAKNAGMKYIVITSKHHDGFGMWPSAQTDWCIKNTPFKRDPLKELAAACKKEGITFCFYHSIMDWHHPDWGTRRAWNDTATGSPDMDRYTAYMKAQLKELLTGYGPLGILWFDGEWESPWTNERGVDLYKYVRSLQPNTIVNTRVGKGRTGMAGMDQGKERLLIHGLGGAGEILVALFERVFLVPLRAKQFFHGVAAVEGLLSAPSRPASSVSAADSLLTPTHHARRSASHFAPIVLILSFTA